MEYILHYAKIVFLGINKQGGTYIWQQHQTALVRKNWYHLPHIPYAV